VVSKGKGSGMLRDLDQLDRFLDEIFRSSPLPVSVKTRLGIEKPEEFYPILEIYNRYPIKELTIHPRVRKQFYDGSVDMDAFRHAVTNSKNPLCYNGDLNSAADIAAFAAAFPDIDAVMIGRGLIADPGMLTPSGTQIAALEAFLNALLECYLSAFGGGRNAMFRLKEHWHLLGPKLGCDAKLLKRLYKTTDLDEYRSITAEIFRSV
jgi:tRNA-dihydrouridine synthase